MSETPINVGILEVFADGESVQPSARAQGDFLALEVSFEHRLEIHLMAGADAHFVVGMHPSGAAGWNYPVPQSMVTAGKRYVLPIVIPPGADGVPFDGEVWLAATPADADPVNLPPDLGSPLRKDESG